MQFLILAGCDFTTAAWGVNWILPLGRGWGRRWGSEGDKKERGAPRRWVENQGRGQSEECFKSYLLLCHHQALVGLSWTTSRKSFSFPLSFFPSQPYGIKCTLFPPVLGLVCVKKVCWYSEHQGILLISDVSYTVGVTGPYLLHPSLGSPAMQ